MPDKRRESEYRRCFAEHYPVVLSYLVSRVGSVEDAEDICQEVFIRLHAHFGEVREKRKWLLAAARFEITNYYGKKATAKSEAADIDDMHDDRRLAVSDGGAENRIIIREVIEDGSNYRDGKERVLFDLVAVYGFSYKEAARYLDMTRWQAEYKYGKIAKRIVERLRQKGIQQVGDLV